MEDVCVLYVGQTCTFKGTVHASGPQQNLKDVPTLRLISSHQYFSLFIVPAVDDFVACHHFETQTVLRVNALANIS